MIEEEEGDDVQLVQYGQKWIEKIWSGMSAISPISALKAGIALVVLGCFVVVWVFALAVPYWGGGVPVNGPTEFQLVLAGILAASVSTGTAAVLGVKVNDSRTLRGFKGKLAGMKALEGTEGVATKEALQALETDWNTKYKLVAIGVTTYVIVGVIVGWTAWNSDMPPEYFTTFTLTFAGWIAGVFGTVFTAESGLQ